MTNEDKRHLQWKVRFMLGSGKSDKEIIADLEKRGYKKATIKNYIRAFSK